jgi:Zn-dependent metalloprotease
LVHGSDIQVKLHRNLGNARFVSIPSDLSFKRSSTEENALKAFLSTNNVFGVRTFEEELSLHSQFTDPVVQSVNTKYQQYYKGLRVFGCELVTVEKDGQLSNIVGN